MNNLDPRLGAGPPPPVQYGNLPAPPPPPSQSQPYYFQTPQNQQSQHNSPHDQIDYSNLSPQDAHDPNNPDDPKRPRACEACRGLKVRCDQDPAHPEIACKRCAKAGRPCVITQPTRKRAKKADSRVAELEKKLDALTQALHQQQGGGNGSGAPAYPGYSYPGSNFDIHRDSTGSVSTPQNAGGYPFSNNVAGHAIVNAPTSADSPVISHKRRRTDDEASMPSNMLPGMLSGLVSQTEAQFDEKPTLNPVLENAAPGFHSTTGSGPELLKALYQTTPDDLIARLNALVDPDTCKSLFTHYTDNLAPHLPAVVFPPGTTAEQTFHEKPILYVCILAAASSGMVDLETSKQLSREAVGALADCVVRNGAKSLELIQAMQVIALWYKPPEHAEQTNFYQIIHMAAVMALDIGLGKRFNAAKARRGFGGPGAALAPGPGARLPQDSDTLEARRAWLGCYYLCASASMVLRRPNLIQWTNYMKESIEVLETSPDAYASDRFFVQHVKVQHICEEIGLQFLMDDSTATISISDPKVSYALKVLENQLKDWNDQIPADIRSSGLDFFYHVTSSYLHEIALHFNHNIDDFRLPFTEESLKSVSSTADTMTANQMSALEACLKAAHGILNILLGYPPDIIKTLPILLYFVRCVYAIVILIKMHVAITSPGSELGKMMKPEDLRVDEYLDGLIKMFGFTGKQDDGQTPHPKIRRILGVLKDWFGKHKESVRKPSSGQQANNTSAEQGQFNGQSSLHLLSQVATGNQQSSSAQQQSSNEQRDWTFDNPSAIPYASTINGPVSSSDPYDQQGQLGTESTGMFDPANPSEAYGWGSGFEQAMDIALGGMDHLAGGEINNWFMGDSMAPFGQFPVDGGVSGW